MERMNVNKLASELQHLYQAEFHSPFPYKDCRKLLSEANEDYEDLIPDLDSYFYNIASHCGGVRKILKWSNEQLLKSREQLGESFFVKYPQYKPLEPMITNVNTPDLYARLELCERLRVNLLELLFELLSELPVISVD